MRNQERQTDTKGQYEIAREIRSAIVRGDLAKGSRLPSHAELVERYGTSRVTVQRAIEMLIQEGFVEGVKRKGRFVAEHPPHSHRVGLIFPGHPERIRSYRWTQYFAALWEAAEYLHGEGPFDIVPYFDIEPAYDGSLTQGYKTLMADLASNRLAGLVFSYAPLSLAESELVSQKPVPTVCLASGNNRWGPGVTLNTERLIKTMVSHLLANNRRRLAWVTIPNTDPRSLRTTLQNMRKQDAFYSPPRWIQALNPYRSKWVWHTLNTMLSAPPEERPDGLVVLDDHLLTPVVEALHEESVSVPDDLQVIGHWNFPLHYTGPKQVTRVGLDTVQQLRLALELLQEERGGGASRSHTSVEPVFATEFKERYTNKSISAYEAEGVNKTLESI